MSESASRPEPTRGGAALFPAFKEWAAVVSALGAGEQTLILRKGGIAEGRGGFAPDRAPRFWLYPTAFHAQAEKLAPRAARFFGDSPIPAVPESLEFFAELTAHRFVDDWHTVAALAPFHVWSEAALRERFEWSHPPGLHLLVLRVYRLDRPLPLPPDAKVAGCRSWIELPLGDPAAFPARPVLNEPAFAQAVAAILAVADAP